MRRFTASIAWVALIVVLVLLSACEPVLSPPELTATAEHITPQPDPTPTQEVQDPFCYGIPGEGFVNIVENQCLSWPMPSAVSPGPFKADVVQWIPDVGWEHFNAQLCQTEEANYYAAIAPILWDDQYNYRVMVEAICGYWGYEQVITVTDPGCYIAKFGYEAHIVDPDWESHNWNYALFASVIRADSVGHTTNAPILVNGVGEAFSTFRLGAGQYILRMGVNVAYASAKEESWIGLQSLSFAWDEDSDHCHGDTPGL